MTLRVPRKVSPLPLLFAEAYYSYISTIWTSRKKEKPLRGSLCESSMSSLLKKYQFYGTNLPYVELIRTIYNGGNDYMD